MKILSNILIYQTIWFICVVKENDFIWAAVLFIALHLFLSTKPIKDIKIMGIVLLLGIIVDGSLLYFGFFSFNVPSYPIPLWLTVLWLGLATLPLHSLSWLKDKMYLSALFGAIGGPLAYWAGVRLGAAIFNYPTIYSLITLAVVWAILWPCVMYAAKQIDSVGGEKSPDY